MRSSAQSKKSEKSNFTKNSRYFVLQCRKLQFLQFLSSVRAAFKKCSPSWLITFLRLFAFILVLTWPAVTKPLYQENWKTRSKKMNYKSRISVKSCWERKILKLIWQISFGKISWSDFRIHDRVCQFLLADLIFDVVIFALDFFEEIQSLICSLSKAAPPPSSTNSSPIHLPNRESGMESEAFW